MKSHHRAAEIHWLSPLIPERTQRYDSIRKAGIFWSNLRHTVLGRLGCAWLELLCSSIPCSIVCLQMKQQRNFIYVTIDDSECGFLFQITFLIITTEDWLLARVHEITLIQMVTPARWLPMSLLSFFLIAEIPFEHTRLPKAETTFFQTHLCLIATHGLGTKLRSQGCVKKQWIALKRGAYLSAYLFGTQVWWLELWQPSGSRREKPGAEAASIQGQESGFFTTALPSDQPWTPVFVDLLRALLLRVFSLSALDWTLTNTLGDRADEELVLAGRAEAALSSLTAACADTAYTAFRLQPPDRNCFEPPPHPVRISSQRQCEGGLHVPFLRCAWTAAWVSRLENKRRRGRHRWTQLYSPHDAHNPRHASIHVDTNSGRRWPTRRLTKKLCFLSASLHPCEQIIFAPSWYVSLHPL